MNERPILFSGAMVRAILDGPKRQTRRVITPQPELYDYRDGVPSLRWKHKVDCCLPWAADYLAPHCSYGQPGDQLWVRETWLEWPNTAGAELSRDNGMGAIYRATWDKSYSGRAWKPSIFMPRKYCRLVLEITDVRVERVQDISEDDARAEGVSAYGHLSRPLGSKGAHTRVTARDAFEVLWDNINQKRGFGWDANPWVWVISFERVQ